MQTEIWIRILAMFSGAALIASVATLIYTQRLLKQCMDLVEFKLFTDEESLLMRLEQQIKNAELSD